MRWLLVLILIALPTLARAQVVTEGGIGGTGGGQVQGDTTVAGELEVTQQGITASVVTETTGNFTLYVKTTGSDSNDCLSSGSPCLTIQEAVDRIPKLVKHGVGIQVGAGSFVGFYLSGFTVEYGGKLTISGEMDLATVTTGTNTGTGTGGSTASLIDSGQSWTTDDLIGRVVEVNGAIGPIIYSNTATTINFAGDGATATGLPYRILDWATILTGAVLTGGLSCTALITGNVISIWEPSGANRLLVQRFEVDTNGLSGGFVYESTNVGSVNHLHVDGSLFGFVFQEVSGPCTVTNSLADNAAFTGFFYSRSTAYAVFDSCLAQSCGSYGGFTIGDSIFFDFGSDVFARGNSGPGIYIYRPNISIRNIGGKLEGNSHGIYVDPAVGNVFLGIGGTTGSNTGYGIKFDGSGQAAVTSATAVTGSSGDATINAGTTTLTWSTDFAANGDLAINISTGTRIKRDD